MAQLLLLLLGVVAFALVRGWLATRALERKLDADARPLDSPTLDAAFARLAEAAGLDRVRAEIVDMPSVNALATPTGRVLLSEPLVRHHAMGLLTDAEVASVAAHELGHMALGHHRRRMVDMAGGNAVRMALIVLIGRFVPIVGVFLADFLASLLAARLSRRDEFEADRYATALMIRAGFGVAPQISMFEKLQRMVPGPKGPAWLASHPPAPERIAAIEANAAAWRAA
jgi:putative metalloprotease